MMICRRAQRAAGRGHRPRLPLRLRLEGLPRDGRGLRHPAARRVCARATGCRSRSSRPRRRPRSGHDQNIDFDAMAALWGAARPAAISRTRVRRAALALYETGSRHAGTAGIILADTKFEFGLPARRRADPDRRGPDARLQPLLGCGRRTSPAGRRPATTSSTSATGWKRRAGTSDPGPGAAGRRRRRDARALRRGVRADYRRLVRALP